jgi:hypothetical protein
MGTAPAQAARPDSGAPLHLGDAGAVPDAAPAADEQCAAESHQASQVPVDLYLLLDVSGSMTALVGGHSKWSLVRQALGRFFADPRSAGLGVALQVFPLPASCQSDADCSPLPGPPGYQCRSRGLCFAPGQQLAALEPCDGFEAACPAGTTCTPLRRCARSGAPCLTLGEGGAGGGGGGFFY